MKQMELKTGRVVDIDGHVDSRGIRYIGKATEQANGAWIALADVAGRLCRVELQLKFLEGSPEG